MSALDSQNPAIAALVARESSNNEKIAELQARIDELAKDNLRIADALSLLREIGEARDVAVFRGTSTPAPSTIPEMIFRSIELAGPQSASALIESIKRQWKPDVDPNNVRPTIWRLVQEDRLKKRGELYELP